jgi:hypothetical protein
LFLPTIKAELPMGCTQRRKRQILLPAYIGLLQLALDIANARLFLSAATP